MVHYCAKTKCKRRYKGNCRWKTDWYMNRMELAVTTGYKEFI